MSEQPPADVMCGCCGHYGVDHISLGGLPSRCRCGCTEWRRPAEHDFQKVSLRLDGPPAPAPQQQPAVYFGGELIPLGQECSRCGQPWDVGHVAQVSNFDRSPRHTDCSDPTLANVVVDD